MQARGLKAVIFGSTGAVGDTLLKVLLESDRWEKILCVARKYPEEWKTLHNKEKLTIQLEPDMDKLLKPQQWQLKGYDSMFVCFGSQVKHGEETFKKVDKTYPLMCAEIAIRNNIPHYLLVSSSGSDPKSKFLYMRTKGEVEAELKEKKLNYLSILKPGLIKNRPDARFGQKVIGFLSFIPFPKIQCMDLGICLKGIAETKHEQALKSQNFKEIYENDDLVKFLNKYNKQNPPKPK